MTSALRGVLEMMTHDDRGEGGDKNCQNGGDVICGCPLIVIVQIFLLIKIEILTNKPSETLLKEFISFSKD